VLFIIGINGFSQNKKSTIECFDYHSIICNDYIPGRSVCNVFTNPILCEEKDSSCFSYDGVDSKNVTIARINKHLEIHLECPQMTSRIDVTDVRYYLTKHTNDICKHPGCNGIAGDTCKVNKCECMPKEDLEMCEESFPEVTNSFNSICNTSNGQCSLNIPRKLLSNCLRSAICLSALTTDYSFCYGQYVKIDYTCISKYIYLNEVIIPSYLKIKLAYCIFKSYMITRKKLYPLVILKQNQFQQNI
jgi:hypothetical protein